jgi:hypothetical protein
METILVLVWAMAIVILVGMVFVALITPIGALITPIGSNKGQKRKDCHWFSLAKARNIIHLLEVNPDQRINQWKIDEITKFCFEILADDSLTKEISTSEAMKWLDIIIQREKKLMDAQNQREKIANLKHIAEHGLTTEQRLNALIELKRIM